MLELREDGRVSDNSILQIGKNHQAAGEIVNILELKDKVIKELEKEELPDIQFLFSPQSIAVASEVFGELFEAERKRFMKNLECDNSEISFEMFLSNDTLDSYFLLLEHALMTQRAPAIEEVMLAIEPAYKKFQGDKFISFRYYEQICYALSHISLTHDQKRVLELQKQKCESQGVHVSAELKEKIGTIKSEIGILTQKFMKNLGSARDNTFYYFKDDTLLGDMPEELKEVAKQKAEEQNQVGYIFTPTNGNELRKYCTDFQRRKETYLSDINLAEEENTKIVLRIIALRKELAILLGHESYSDGAFDDKMAESSEKVKAEYSELANKYLSEFQYELEVLQKSLGIGEVNPWDYAFYKNAFLETERTVEDAEFQKYREYKSVLKGVLTVIEKTFGVSFEVTDIKTYHEDVSVYEVFYKGKRLGYYMPDFFARPGKRQGGWAEVLRKSVSGQKLVTNASNITKSVEGNTYLSFYDIRVIFHELGHMLHELLSPQSYSDLSGFNVESDAVEIPSKFMENLITHRDSVALYMRHEDTREGLSNELFESFVKEAAFGFSKDQLGRIERSFLDFSLHGGDIPHSESELRKLTFGFNQEFGGLPGLLEGEYNISPNFHHLFFGNDTYISAYYSYIWSDMLQEKIWEEAINQGDIFGNRYIEKYVQSMLSQGARRPSMELFNSIGD